MRHGLLNLLQGARYFALLVQGTLIAAATCAADAGRFFSTPGAARGTVLRPRLASVFGPNHRRGCLQARPFGDAIELGESPLPAFPAGPSASDLRARPRAVRLRPEHYAELRRKTVPTALPFVIWPEPISHPTCWVAKAV
jgi:hypothetical protein